MLNKLWEKFISVTGSGLVDKIIDVAKTYFPPDLSPEQQMQFKIACRKLQIEHENQTQKLINQAEKQLTQRISQLEGTASDLLALPVVGRVLLFLRGAQRPIWGFATLYLDWCWFASWQLSEQQETALTVINVLVLGFLFGERAMKNVMPLLKQVTRNAIR
ncbi:hypothetical protein [Spartinivicinus ruber]|uniref:hypothetical protein n=1 Tax=Spartinivicinus ruber TaxID=2683272 RepID=UPI0013D88530|nr:hypothetical protein [Spartinivicinus ruber]